MNHLTVLQLVMGSSVDPSSHTIRNLVIYDRLFVGRPTRSVLSAEMLCQLQPKPEDKFKSANEIQVSS